MYYFLTFLREGQKQFINLTDLEREQYHHYTELQLKKIIQTYQIDVMLVNHLVYNPVIASPVCKQAGIPFAIIPHGSSIEYVIKKDEKYKKLALNPLLQTDSIIVGSEEMKQRIAYRYSEFEQELQKKFIRISIGVETALFRPINFEEREQTVISVIQELTSSTTNQEQGKQIDETKTEDNPIFRNLDEVLESMKRVEKGDINKPDANLAVKLQQIPWRNGKIIVFLGALISAKGIHSLITAFASIVQKHPGTHLLIIGSGFFRSPLEAIIECISDGNIELLQQIAEVGFDIDNSGLAGPFQDLLAYLEEDKNIKLLKKSGKRFKENVQLLGRINHSILNRIFPCADVAVFPSSVSEAYMLVLLESLASGVLFMASNKAGNKALIDELEGTLGEEITDRMRIPAEDGERIFGIEERICEALDNVEKLREMKQKLRDVAVEKYDWKSTAEQLEKAFTSTIANSSN